MMQIFPRDNLWAIAHAGKVIKKRFTSEANANAWADANIDDQVFDEPNSFSAPLEYEPDLIVRYARSLTKNEEGGNRG